jgi:hypothetical protein
MARPKPGRRCLRRRLRGGGRLILPHQGHREDDIQITPQFGAALIALLAVALHGLEDDGIKTRIETGQAGGGGLERATRHLAGEHLIEHDADGIQVRATINVRAKHEHLGSDEVGRAHGVTGLRETMRAGFLDLRQSEVGHFHLALHVDEHVGRFDVAVDDAQLVRGAERIAHMRGDGQRVIGRELPLRADHLGDISAIDILHGEVEQAAGGEAKVVYTNYRRII